MTTKAVRYTQPLLGAVPGSDVLTVVDDPAEVLIRQDGDACTVYGDNDKGLLSNPIPLRVGAGAAGVSVRGELLVYLEAGRGYDAVVTLGAGSEAVVTIVTLPDISPDVADAGGAVAGGLAAEIAAREAGDAALDVRVDALEAAGGGGGALAVTVPHWDHAEPASIYHGAFWPTGVDLGPFDWEAWVRHDTGAEYWISEGFGGAHAVLAGFSGGSPTGNVWDGTTSHSYGGVYTAQDGEWLNHRVIWDGATIWCLINGIVVGSLPFAGPRRAQYGDALIGGSDHSNWQGCVAQVRAWEGQVGNGLPWYGYNVPVERYFSDRHQSSGVLAQFVTDYLSPTDTFPDRGDGFAGQLHPGAARGAYNGFGFENSSVPHPVRVVDETAPFGAQKDVARTRTFAAPAAAPTGAKIWDSFGRADSIWAFTSHPTMGSTEAGSLGVKAWSHLADQWGVFDGAAICGTQNLFARVANDSPDMDVRAQRLVDSTHGFSYCSAAARITADRASGWTAKVYKDDTGTYAVLVRPNGTTAGSWLTSGTWTHLRLVASGTTFTVYVLELGLGGWTNLGNVTGETANQAEVGAGLYHDFAVGTQARYLDFEVR